MGVFKCVTLVRVERIELSSLAWKAGILAIIRHPQNRGNYTKCRVIFQFWRQVC